MTSQVLGPNTWDGSKFTVGVVDAKHVAGTLAEIVHTPSSVVVANAVAAFEIVISDAVVELTVSLMEANRSVLVAAGDCMAQTVVEAWVSASVRPAHSRTPPKEKYGELRSGFETAPSLSFDTTPSSLGA
jgi:hypothetical protein